MGDWGEPSHEAMRNDHGDFVQEAFETKFSQENR